MKDLKLWLWLILAGTQALAQTTQFYVSQSSGNDSNAGTQAAPFKTIAKAQSMATSCPVAVNLYGQDTWHEQYTVQCAGTTIQSYGGSGCPLLDESDPVAANSWTVNSTYSNVYQETQTISTGSAIEFVNIYYAGTNLPLPRYATLAALAAASNKNGGVYVSSDAASPVNIYILPVNGTRPASDANLYSVTDRDFAINGNNYSGTTVSGICARRPKNQNAAIELFNNAVVNNVVVSDTSKHALYYQDNSVISGVYLHNAYYCNPAAADNTEFGIGFITSSNSGTITVKNSVAAQDANVQALQALSSCGKTSSTGGWYTHTLNAGGNTFADITYNGVSATNTPGGGIEANGTTVNFTNVVSDSGIGAAGVDCQVNQATATTTFNATFAGSFYCNNLFITNSYFNALGTGPQGVLWINATNPLISISNSQIGDLGTSLPLIQITATSIAGIYSRNNKFITSSNQSYWSYSAPPPSNYSEDYDTYINGGTFWIDGVSYTLAQMQSKFGLDANSQIGIPASAGNFTTLNASDRTTLNGKGGVYGESLYVQSQNGLTAPGSYTTTISSTHEQSADSGSTTNAGLHILDNIQQSGSASLASVYVQQVPGQFGSGGIYGVRVDDDAGLEFGTDNRGITHLGKQMIQSGTLSCGANFPAGSITAASFTAGMFSVGSGTCTIQFLEALPANGIGALPKSDYVCALPSDVTTPANNSTWTYVTSITGGAAYVTYMGRANNGDEIKVPPCWAY